MLLAVKSFCKWCEPSCHLQRLSARAEVYTEQRMTVQTSRASSAFVLESSWFRLVRCMDPMHLLSLLQIAPLLQVYNTC